MQRRIPAWTITKLAAFALAFAVPAYRPANAQGSVDLLAIRHLAPEAMSTSDRAAVDAHQQQIIEAARIYSYNLEAGNWSYTQTLCAPMPDTILLHYSQYFPDRTESLFTVLVPRHAGRVRIVPVLFHSTTPFLPAPKNPHNYVLFNELVPSNIARRGAGGGSNSLELSACYAELTGVPTHLPAIPDADIGIAGAPAATMYVDVQHQSTHVTFANREGERTYKIWSIAFSGDGRVTAASTEDRSVAPALTAESSETSQPEKTTVQSPQASAGITNQAQKNSAEASPASPAPVTASKTQPTTASTLSAPRTATVPATPIPAASAGPAEPSEPGWKYVLHPAEPPSKIVPHTPSPSEKDEAEPPDAAARSASQAQPPQ